MALISGCPVWVNRLLSFSLLYMKFEIYTVAHFLLKIFNIFIHSTKLYNGGQNS